MQVCQRLTKVCFMLSNSCRYSVIDSLRVFAWLCCPETKYKTAMTERTITFTLLLIAELPENQMDLDVWTSACPCVISEQWVISFALASNRDLSTWKTCRCFASPLLCPFKQFFDLENAYLLLVVPTCIKRKSHIPSYGVTHKAYFQIPYSL